MSGSQPTSENCLANKFPEIASQWHSVKNGSLFPHQVKSGSCKKVWWVCSNNHEWKTYIRNRTRGVGCPYCSGRRSTKESCLSTKFPEIANQWHSKLNGKLTPNNISYSSNKKVWWICKHGHEWFSSLNSRTRKNGNRCPYCAGQKVSIDNCLATKFPHLIKEWHCIKNDNKTPYNTLSKSGKKVWWVCSKKHIYLAKVSQRANGSNCPFCSGRLAAKETCLLTKNPLLCKEWDYSKNKKITPENVTEFSHKKVWWKCINNHEWESTISGRSRGDGCPHCNKILLKDGTILDSMPEAIKYLEYQENKMIFKHNEKYHTGFGNFKYDFYFPKENKYVEVTSYSKGIFGKKFRCRYIAYLRNIVKKRRFVENILKAKFEFIQFKPTREQIKKVREWTK